MLPDGDIWSVLVFGENSLEMIGTSRKQKAPTLNRRPLLPRARRNQLFACVNEVDAIALVLKAKGEAELLPAVCRIVGVEELNIGHSIVSRAVLVGMERAVREMKEAIRCAERVPA